MHIQCIQQIHQGEQTYQSPDGSEMAASIGQPSAYLHRAPADHLGFSIVHLWFRLDRPLIPI